MRAEVDTEISNFVPRTNLRRDLNYRPVVTWVCYGEISLTVIISSAFIVQIIDQICSHELTDHLVEDGFNFLVITFACLSALLFLRPLSRKKVLVESTQLTVHTGGNSKVIDFSSIERVDIRIIPYIGGWFSLILKNGTRHYFTAALERTEYILETLAVYDLQLFDSRSIELYRNTIVTVDHASARANANLTDWRRLGRKLLVAPLSATYLCQCSFIFTKQIMTAQKFGQDLILFFGLNAGLICSLYVTAEFILAADNHRRLKRNVSRPSRNLSLENQLKKLSEFLVYLVLLALLLSSG